MLVYWLLRLSVYRTNSNQSQLNNLESTSKEILDKETVYVGKHGSILTNNDPQGQSMYQRGLLLILNDPQRLTIHIFKARDTLFLAGVLLSLILIQFLLFLATTLNRGEAHQYYSTGDLVSIAYFQTISTRSAGFAMIDFRLLDQVSLALNIITPLHNELQITRV